MPLFVGAGHDEILDFHLLEFAYTEDEVLRRDLVAVRLTDLSDAKRQFPVRRVEDVLEVDENALRRFRPQISNIVVVLDGAHRRLEHEVERTRLGEVMRAAFRTLFGRIDLIGPKAFLALAAIHERIGESGLVAGVPQDQTVHQDRRVKTFHVIALVNVCAPPRPLDVVLELDAHRPVVPRSLQPTIKFAALEEEPPPFAKRDDLVHRGSRHQSSSCAKAGIYHAVGLA